MNDKYTKMPAIKHMISTNILGSLHQWCTPEEHAYLHAYIVDALGECNSLGDIQLFIPIAILKEFKLGLIASKTLPSLNLEQVAEIKSKHERAHSFIQQYLLLRMIED